MNKCDNCKTCPVMGIDEKLRKTYDWAANFRQFEQCGVGPMSVNENPNILCFTKYFAKKVNWKEIEKMYNTHKKLIDEDIKNGRLSLQNK